MNKYLGRTFGVTTDLLWFFASCKNGATQTTLKRWTTASTAEDFMSFLNRRIIPFISTRWKNCSPISWRPTTDASSAYWMRFFFHLKKYLSLINFLIVWIWWRILYYTDWREKGKIHTKQVIRNKLANGFLKNNWNKRT